MYIVCTYVQNLNANLGISQYHLFLINQTKNGRVIIIMKNGYYEQCVRLYLNMFVTYSLLI